MKRTRGKSKKKRDRRSSDMGLKSTLYMLVNGNRRVDDDTLTVCPHLYRSVRLERNYIRHKREELTVSKKNSTVPVVVWKCLECSCTDSNWICLNCGVVLCGRYKNAHALNHSKTNAHHNICMSTDLYAVYCYDCDEYVLNDTDVHKVRRLRDELMDEDSEAESLASSSVKSFSHESSSGESSDSGWADEPAIRQLRPRKRTISGDSDAKRRKVRVLSRESKLIIGMINTGNSCFMNAVLTALLYVHKFGLYICALPCLEAKSNQPQPQLKRLSSTRGLKNSKDSSTDMRIVQEIRRIMVDLSSGCEKKVAADKLLLMLQRLVPQFRGNRQQDAHEFLRYVLDCTNGELQQSMRRINGTNSRTNAVCSINRKHSKNTIVQEIFGGSLQNEVRCLVCGTESRKLETFLDLSLDMPQKTGKEKGDNDPVSIADCLQRYTEVEELRESEYYKCTVCDCKQRSTKRLWIGNLPNVLCLHIKRFSWNSGFRTKIDQTIKFPMSNLDMTPFAMHRKGPETRRTVSNLFDLTALIVHHGNGATSGHYTSYVKFEGQWIHFNDSIVRAVPQKEVANCQPYILFYTRKDINKSL